MTGAFVIHRIRLWADRKPCLFIVMLIAVCILISVLSGFVFSADLKLSWDPSDGATGYRVQISTDLGKTWSEPNDAGDSVTLTWMGAPDTGLILFRVSAYNSQGEAVNYNKGAWYRGDRGAPAMASSLGLE